MISSSTVSRNANTRQVLSLDGGGIRGIVSSKILSAVLSQMGNLQVPDVFDLVAGTSTGSLVAAGCIVPDPNNPSQPLFTASKIHDLMVTQGPQVFHQSFIHEVVSGYGILEPKYNPQGLKSVIATLGGDDLLSNLMTDFWLPASVKNNLSAFYFSRQKARSDKDWGNLKLSEVLPCTTAAPYYFPSENLTIGNKCYSLLDGGLFANNPVSNAISQARELFNCGDNQICLSIGTGYKVYDYSPSEGNDEGLLRVLPWVIDCAINASMANSLYTAQQTLGNRLFRFSPELTNDSLDDASAKNITYLENATQSFIEQNSDSIELAAKTLKEKMPGEKPGAPCEAYS